MLHRQWFVDCVNVPTAGKWHDTERTHVITTTSNRYSTHSIATQANGFNIVVGFLFTENHIDRLATTVELLQQFGKSR